MYRWKPWEHSKVPKSDEGEAKSAMRGYKGDVRDFLRMVAKTLKESDE
jgi:hypothetical protein